MVELPASKDLNSLGTNFQGFVVNSMQLALNDSVCGIILQQVSLNAAEHQPSTFRAQYPDAVMGLQELKWKSKEGGINTKYLVSMKGSFTATTSTPSIPKMARSTSRPILPAPGDSQNQ